MIVAEHVTKYYGARAAVSDLSFRIEEREVVGLLGLNGAGKTTTLRILSGLLVPTAGRVYVGGLDMAENPEGARARIGFLPETPPLYTEMRVEGFLRFVAHIKGMERDVEPAIDEALAKTDLVHVRREVIGTLSHGYQRRVGIAQAIVNRPALILLDEPTSGLDPVQIVQMRKLVRGLKERHTVLVSSHLLGEIHEVCDRIFVLQEGKIAAEGSEAELAKKVHGGVRVTVEVRGAAQALSEAVGRLSGARCHIEDSADGVARASVDLDADRRDELAKAVVTAGLGLLRLEKQHAELESIFLKLTTAHGKAGLEKAG